MLRRGVLALVGLYGLYAIGAVALHPQFIYPFDQIPFQLNGYAEREIAPDVYVAEAVGTGQPVVYFAGNVGALAYYRGPLTMHQSQGRHVVALEYPGSGGKPGSPSEARIKAQALEAFDWLAAQSDVPIIVHGYSLGAAVALYVASQRDVAAVILDSPFARICEQMTRASALPACWMPFVQKWNSIAVAKDVKAPILIQHGTEDTLTLLTDGKRLAQALVDAGVSVAFHEVAGAGHQNITQSRNYQSTIDDFIAKASEAPRRSQ